MIELNNNQKIIVSIVLVIILFVIGFYIWNITSGNSNKIEILEDNQINTGQEIENDKIEILNEIIIHIAGAVENEGIQKLPENSRVADAIDAAGGLSQDANMDSINLAQKIADGQKIYIPFKTEENVNSQETQVVIEEPEAIIQDPSQELVNINLATRYRA